LKIRTATLLSRGFNYKLPKNLKFWYNQATLTINQKIIMKNTIITILILVVLCFGIYFLISDPSSDTYVAPELDPTINNQIPEIDPVVESQNESETIIGKSIERRDIIANHYGTGDTEILFVGGIHGGYEWNTSLLAYEMMDYLEANPSVIPDNVKVTIIPVLNPDGLNKTVGTSARFESTDVPSDSKETIAGRFNANEVDLNRNFDCKWKETGTWQNKTVSAGTEAFSEPESQAIKSYITTQKPQAVVVWYSSAGGIYTSNCNGTVLAETKTLARIFAEASNYPNEGEFTSYEINGDMVNWLAKKSIPAISVLLTNHTDTEKNKNQAGVKAILKHYSK